MEKRPQWMDARFEKPPKGSLMRLPLTEIAKEASSAATRDGRETSSYLFPRAKSGPRPFRRRSRRFGEAALRAGRGCRLISNILRSRSTYADRLSAGGVAERVGHQLLRKGDAKGVQKEKYSQMKKLQRNEKR